MLSRTSYRRCTVEYSSRLPSSLSSPTIRYRGWFVEWLTNFPDLAARQGSTRGGECIAPSIGTFGCALAAF
jgi:hypothetical protein